jgi:hypothetical protein
MNDLVKEYEFRTLNITEYADIDPPYQKDCEGNKNM